MKKRDGTVGSSGVASTSATAGSGARSGLVLVRTALLSVGSMTATYTAGTACSDAYVPTTALTCSHKWGQVGSLAGIAVLGAFFATVWADVPLARNFSVRATDSGRVQMAAAFRF